MKRVLVSLSGGMDSATVLAQAIAARNFGIDEVVVCSFTYGSKHNEFENGAAADIADHYGLCLGDGGDDEEHTFIDLEAVMSSYKSNLLKSGGDIPEGHYEAESMKQTVVPARNMIFAAILAGVAESQGCSEVWMGMHQGDHAIYPDCRPNFVRSMNNSMLLATSGKVQLIAPVLEKSKFQILQLGNQLDVPYHLTRTCYKDQQVACGVCGACQERLAAFKRLGIEDPIEYESREILPETQ